MASYIDNIFQNARIQDVQAFTPDWNFLSQGQAQLSATQKKNFSDFAQRYNSIIDGELSRQDNVALRDAYKKQADEFVKQVSGLDLTDPRNVKAADAVFNPLVDNKMYIRDILNTRAVKDTYAKAQQYATSLNPAERDLYNEDSLKQLNYFLQDFKTASPEEALTMQAPGYTPGINLEKMALNFFNRQQYDVEVEQNTGQWIVKTKNGQLVKDNLMAGLMAEFVGDPLVRQNILLKNNMQKRDFVESNLMNYGGDKNAAEVAYYQQRYSGVLNQLERQGKRVSEEIDLEVEVANTVIKQLAKGENVDNIPMSDEPLTVRERLVQTSEQLKRLQQGIKQENSQVIAAGTTKSKATSPYTVNIDGKSYTPEQLDSIIFQGEVGGIANRLAMSRFSQTTEANPFAMEQWKSDLSWKNKERELRLEAELEAQAAQASLSLSGLNGPIDFSMGSKEILEGLEDKPSEALNIQQAMLLSESKELKTLEDSALKQYFSIRPDEKKKAISEMSQMERNTALKKAQALISSGALPKNIHSDLSAIMLTYDAQRQVTDKVYEREKTNNRNVANDPEITEEDRPALLYAIENSSTLPELKARYAEKLTSDAKAKREADFGQSMINIVNNPFSIVSEGASLLRQATKAILEDYPDPLGFDSIEEDVAEKTEKMFGDGDGSFSKVYLKQARNSDPSVFGYNIGIGGNTTFGKDLGQATNTREGISDYVLNYAYRAAVGNNINSYYTGDIKSATSENLRTDGQVIPILQTFVDQINQKQKETAGTLRTVNVKVTIDPATQEQLVHFRPNEALTETIYSKDDGTPSIVSESYARSVLSNGITVRLPANSIPSNVIGVEKLTPVQKLFKVKNEVTLGGNMSADKGIITISKNASGSFDVIGSRYENGKVIPLGKNLEDHVNNVLYPTALAQRQAGMGIDPDAYVIQQLELTLDNF